MADLSDGTNWFETDASNNRAPPNGWPEGMMPSGVNDAARSGMGALKRFWDRINPIQTVTPSGTAWTFTTGNPAYPTSYVDGELYTFKAGGPSPGSDTFGVNGLDQLPIWKRIAGGTGFAPIIANDIVGSLTPQLVHNASLNGGSGAWLLLNPFVPVFGDGAGGVELNNVSVTGALAVSGDIVGGGNITAAGGLYLATPTIQLAGPTGINMGIGSTRTGNNRWQLILGNSTTEAGSNTGSDFQINRYTDAGIVIDAPLTINRATGAAAFTDALSVAGALSVTGAATFTGTASFGVVTTTGLMTLGAGLHLTGAATFSGALSVTGTTTLAALSVTDAATLSSTLGVSGQLTAAGLTYTNSLYVVTTATVQGTLAVSGAATLNSTLNVSGQLSAGGLTYTNSLYVVTSATINALVISTGAQAGYQFYSRDNAGQNWTMWADGGYFHFGNNTSGGFLSIAGWALYPYSNNSVYCGNTGFAWAEVMSYQYLNASDIKDKTDIEPLPDCLGLVTALVPKRFRFTNGPEEGRGTTHWGFVAQDVGQVMRDAGHPFGGHRDDPEGQSISYHELTAVLWKACQEMAARISAMEKA